MNLYECMEFFDDILADNKAIISINREDAEAARQCLNDCYSAADYNKLIDERDDLQSTLNSARECYEEMREKHARIAKEYLTLKEDAKGYLEDIKDYKREIADLESKVAINKAKVEAYESIIKMVKELR